MPSSVLDTGDRVSSKTVMVFIRCTVSSLCWSVWGGKTFVGYVMLCVNVKGTTVFASFFQ